MGEVGCDCGRVVVEDGAPRSWNRDFPVWAETKLRLQDSVVYY